MNWVFSFILRKVRDWSYRFRGWKMCKISSLQNMESYMFIKSINLVKIAQTDRLGKEQGKNDFGAIENLVVKELQETFRKTIQILHIDDTNEFRLWHLPHFSTCIGRANSWRQIKIALTDIITSTFRLLITSLLSPQAIFDWHFRFCWPIVWQEIPRKIVKKRMPLWQPLHQERKNAKA